MNADSWIVGVEDQPSAGRPGECFWCQATIGAEHKADCVRRKRTVVVRYEIEFTTDVPEHWTKDDFEFHRNESSWCADNLIDELEGLKERGCCLCSFTEASFVREATDDDEQKSQLFISKIHSAKTN